MPSARDFLDELWAGCAEGHILLRSFDLTQDLSYSDSFRSREEGLDAVVRDIEGFSSNPVFMGLALREAPESDAQVISVPALWTTININSVPILKAIEAVRGFPARPSAGIHLGEAMQVFWFLKSPLLPKDFDLVWAANQTIINKLSGIGPGDSHYDPFLSSKSGAMQSSHYDRDGLVRAPGQPGARIVSWRPELRYTLEEFADIISPRKVKAPPPLMPAPTGTQAPGGAGARSAPAARLSDAKVTEASKFLSEIWSPGDEFQRELAEKAAGWFASAGISVEIARAVIGGAAEAVGADTQTPVQSVDIVYEQFVQGASVPGKQAFEKLVSASFPPLARAGAKKVIEKVDALLPKKRPAPAEDESGGGGGRGAGRPPSQGAEPDFDIVKIIKFNSRPARYRVIVRKHGESADYEIPCEIEVYANIKKFRIAFLEHTENKFIANIKQHRWERLVSRAKLEIQEAPEEATGSGAIRAKLESFLEEKKENPELGELKSFPGYTDDEMFFQLDAFRRRLRDAGVKVSDREIVHVLRDQGWADDRRWISNKNPRLWVKAILKGGGTNGNGNGHGPGPGGPKPPDDSLPPELFPPSGDLAVAAGDGGTPEVGVPTSRLPDAHEPVERQPGEDAEEVSQRDAGGAE